jgi:hypothetical protein
MRIGHASWKTGRTGPGSSPAANRRPSNPSFFLVTMMLFLRKRLVPRRKPAQSTPERSSNVTSPEERPTCLNTTFMIRSCFGGILVRARVDGGGCGKDRRTMEHPQRLHSGLFGTKQAGFAEESGRFRHFPRRIGASCSRPAPLHDNVLSLRVGNQEQSRSARASAIN